MRQWIGPAILSALFALSAPPLFAQEAPSPPAPPAPPWKANLEFSYLETSGNTNTSALLAGGKGEYDFSESKILGEGRGLYGRSNGITSEKSWFFKAEYDYNLTERTVVFVLQSAERNTLKGIEGRYISQAGFGHYFLKSKADVLKVEAGAGYTRENQVPPNPDRGFPNARLSAGYTHNFSEKTQFEETGSYIPSLKYGKDYLMNEESAVTTNLAGHLALKVSYSIAYNNQPPPGFKTTDRLFKTALLYTF